MASNTNITEGGLVTFAIKVNGSPIPETTDIYSIRVESSVNKISSAEIKILDGNASTGKFEVSSSKTFIPGADISIEAGYDTKNKVIFKGIITQQQLKVSDVCGSMLTVVCRDKSIKMVVGRKCLTFNKKKDSDIISSIIGGYSGLSSQVTSTSQQWPEQVQYYSTDWDFILSRAETNGLIVTTINNKVSVIKPNADTSPVLTLEFGNNLLEFDADLNAITQLSNVKASAWDYKTQKVISGEAKSDLSGPGNLSTKKLSEVVGLADFDLQTSGTLEDNELTNWSKAQIIKSEYSKIIGEAKSEGTSIIEPGKYITLQGLGTRFNGDHLVSGVVHEISDGNWITTTSIGMSPVWFTEEPDVVAPPASGLLPGIRGLYTGTVKKINEDPDNQYRVLVEIPLFDQKGEGIWARLTNFYSTSGAGAFFMLEVNDEVVMGFLNEDPRFPIILGSMYSNSKNKPFKGLEPDEKNSKKAIVTKSGLEIEFDDENKVLTVVTPDKNTIILSDKDKKITIKDDNSNSIEMSSSGITMKSQKDISIEASQNLTLKGNMGVTIEASTGDVQVKGINIKESAQSEYSAQGSMMAQVQGGMELTLKGAMVMIN